MLCPDNRKNRAKTGKKISHNFPMGKNIHVPKNVPFHVLYQLKRPNFRALPKSLSSCTQFPALHRAFFDSVEKPLLRLNHQRWSSSRHLLAAAAASAISYHRTNCLPFVIKINGVVRIPTSFFLAASINQRFHSRGAVLHVSSLIT